MEVSPKEIRSYLSVNGINPFSEWFDFLRDVRAKAKIRARLDRVEAGNLGDCKSVGNGVFELRIDYVLATAYTLVRKVQQLLFFYVVAIKALKIKILLKLRNIGKTIGVEMMYRSTSYHEKLIQDLQNPLEAAAYIEVVLEEGDPKMLSKALKNVIEAQGGINQLSLQVQQLYRQFEQMLSEKGEIEFYNLNSLLDALGLQLAVTVKP